MKMKLIMRRLHDALGYEDAAPNKIQQMPSTCFVNPPKLCSPGISLQIQTGE